MQSQDRSEHLFPLFSLEQSNLRASNFPFLHSHHHFMATSIFKFTSHLSGWRVGGWWGGRGMTQLWMKPTTYLFHWGHFMGLQSLAKIQHLHHLPSPLLCGVCTQYTSSSRRETGGKQFKRMRAVGQFGPDLECCFVFLLSFLHDSRDVAASISDLPSVAHCVFPHSVLDIFNVTQTAVFIRHWGSRNLQSEMTSLTISVFLCVFSNQRHQPVCKLITTLCCCQTSKQQDQQGKQRVEAHSVVCSHSSGKEINVYHQPSVLSLRLILLLTLATF